MLLCQEGDELHPIELGEILADVMPNADLVVMGSQDELLQQLPQLVAQVAAFLASADG
jgi:hypothetical protein